VPFDGVSPMLLTLADLRAVLTGEPLPRWIELPAPGHDPGQ
jgi:hypothetical protein